MSGKTCLVFVDGTHLSQSDNSIIHRLYKLFSEADNVEAKYYVGIGVNAKYGLIEAGLANNFHQQVVEIYEWVIERNLSENDVLIIVGFSRGAAAAKRVVAGLMDPVTLNKNFQFNGFGRGAFEAQIRLVGLIDCVYGYDKDSKKAIFNPAALNSERIENVFELISADERRHYIRYENLSFVDESGDLRSRQVREICGAPVQSSEFERVLASGSLRRQKVLVPGVHGDLGGVGDASIGAHSLLLTLREILRVRPSLSELFDRDQLETIATSIVGRVPQFSGYSHWFEYAMAWKKRRFNNPNDILVYDLHEGLCGSKGHKMHFFSRFMDYALCKSFENSKKVSCMDTLKYFFKRR